ncbi:hypothetical protein [Bacillus sp. MRMR6]|uniref:hypothetical protein n=1 Tax=Bacillus sp. MRMR6 TaxID=1928617 RepID=UPI00095257F7|nr:hypothetical protein [Bacillus sp. MRMR6]OLS39147.1 hypothetical protein BTR25_13525 [Bacillus sp. MRMR6]
MSLNLWKLAGLSTSFNPLPTGLTANNRVSLNVLQPYVVTLKAKSMSGGRLELINNLVNKGRFTLDGNFKTYTFEITPTPNSTGFHYLYDVDSKGDIIIEDIQLVQKPLPKLTINGIDGFLSGKWNISPDATVIDDETLELNATGTYRASLLDIDVKPLSTYTVSFDGDGQLVIQDRSDNSYYTPGMSKGRLLFTTKGGTNRIRIWFQNTNVLGKFTFKRPMLNLGTTPSPYEKKRGERMVLPVAKKNLFNFKNYVNAGFTHISNGYKATGYSNGVSSINPFLKPNTTYTLTCNVESTSGSASGAYGRITLQNGVSFFHLNAGASVGFKQNTFTTPSDIALYNTLIIYGSATANEIVEITDIMLVEGTTATPYEPYAVQVNKKPLKYVPKKNLLPTFNWVKADIYCRYDVLIVNKYTYALQAGSGYAIGVDEFTSSGSLVKWNPYASSLVITPQPTTSVFRVWLRRIDNTNMQLSEIESARPQLEHSSQSTPYEPYQLVLPRAKTGLAFNGTSDYLQLPSMTMDSIEIDCLIDSKVSSKSQYIFDARGGLADGYLYFRTIGTIDKGTSFSYLVDGITNGNIPEKQRTKIKAIFTNPFTDDVSIFSRFEIASGSRETLKGTLYKVTCYLNGAVVATYDFENPSNIVGDKVIPNAKNLIPSFEDSRWNLHPNFKVLGKDVGRLDGIGDFLDSTIVLNVSPNTSYLASSLNGGEFSVRQGIGVIGTSLFYIDNGLSLKQTNGIFTVPSNVNQVTIRLSNRAARGSFDFIKPQLYELTGKEGTIVGRPQPLRRAAKRLLYAKR